MAVNEEGDGSSTDFTDLTDSEDVTGSLAFAL